jgi:Flp pilus assembly protein TadD
MSKPRPRPRRVSAPDTSARPAPSPQPRKRSTLIRLAPLVIVLAGALAYANSLKGPLIFDDYRSIVDNATVRQLSWTTVLHPQRQTPVAGRPLANLSLALNYAIGGQSVETYHLWNVGVHILAALLLFGILRRTAMWPTADDRTRDHVALFCALAWLVHPLNTDAVDYITQRTESMAGLFYLLTLYAAIHAWQDEAGWRWPVAGVVACWCGVATKELAVTAPVMVLLWDRCFVSGTFRAAFRRRGRLYLALASGWLLFVVLSLDTPFFSATGFETSVSPWTYLLNQAPLIVRYLRLSVWPVGLVVDYGLPRSLTLAEVWPSALVVLALLGLVIVALRKNPTVGFWGAWFFVTLAPASSVLPIPSEVGAERRMYLPLVAVVMLLASLWRRIVQPLPAVQARALGAAFGLTALLALSTGTVWRNSEFRSGLSIWETVVARYPHARAHENLAIQLRDAGRGDEAIEHLRVAAPELPDARHALGSALLDRGDLKGGIAELEAFVAANPRDHEIVSARDELASALIRVGDLDRATAEFEALVTIEPQDPKANAALIGLLLRQERFADAETQARAFVTRVPGNAVAHNLLGVSLASTGNIDDAVHEFQTAVQIDPQSTEARNNLARALEQSQRPSR